MAHYNLSFIFVALPISYIGYDNVVLRKVIAEIWECGDITGNGPKGAKQTGFARLSLPPHLEGKVRISAMVHKGQII